MYSCGTKRNVSEEFANEPFPVEFDREGFPQPSKLVRETILLTVDRSAPVIGGKCGKEAEVVKRKGESCT